MLGRVFFSAANISDPILSPSLLARASAFLIATVSCSALAPTLPWCCKVSGLLALLLCQQLPRPTHPSVDRQLFRPPPLKASKPTCRLLPWPPHRSVSFSASSSVSTSVSTSPYTFTLHRLSSRVSASASSSVSNTLHHYLVDQITKWVVHFFLPTRQLPFNLEC